MGKGSSFRSLVLAPGQMDVLGVHARPQDFRLTILELAVQAPELGDLGGADEGEILGPEEQHHPLAGVALVGDGLEGFVRVGGHGGGEGEFGKLVAYGQHGVLLVDS